jgi:hypothetical protein
MDNRINDDVSQNAPGGSDKDDPRVFAAVQKFLAALESGRRPSRREFVAQHPEIAEQLAACLDGLAFIHSAAGELNRFDSSSSGRAEMPIDLNNAQPLGDFRLLREIGRGGMGVVYEALQLSLGRRVALKVLPLAAAMDSRYLERFHNEAQAAARLHHTNIVPVYAVGSERSVHFYAMQLINGRGLDVIIAHLRQVARPSAAAAENSPPTLPRAWTPATSSVDVTTPLAPPPGLEAAASLTTMRASRGSAYARSVAGLGVQVAEALEYAHRAGVVHRDIKPANLLLDNTGTLWITDFGLAQFYAENNLTRSGDLIGTLRYMSPEQAAGRGAVLDQRTDIYSLGVTLYELLTLHRAFPGTTHEELLHQITHVDPPPARSIDRTVPRELEIILGKAMAKEPAERYASARQFADDLQRFLKDEPILARPPSAWNKTLKWTRRHKALTLSAITMLVVGFIASTISTLLIARQQGLTETARRLEHTRAIEANRQQRRAERSWQQARQAVDFFSRMAITMDEPQVSNERRDMLEEALSYYEAFIEDRSGDPSVVRELDAAEATVATALSRFTELDAAVHVLDRIRLLDQPSVRKDLGITSEQAAAALQLASIVSPRYSRPQSPATTREATMVQAAAINSQLDKILGAEQAERLRQIDRQLRGPTAFGDADVETKLSLSREQRDKIRTIELQYRAARFDAAWPSGEDGKPMVETVRRDMINRVLAELTPDQVEKWKALTGAPFTGHLVRDSSLHGRGPMDRLGPPEEGPNGPPPDGPQGPRPRPESGQRGRAFDPPDGDFAPPPPPR